MCTRSSRKRLRRRWRTHRQNCSQAADACCPFRRGIRTRCESLCEYQPASATDLGRRADRIQDRPWQGGGDLQHFGKVGLLRRQRRADRIAPITGLFLCECENAFFDEGEVVAVGIFFALADDRFLVGKLTQDCPELDAERSCGSQAPAAKINASCLLRSSNRRGSPYSVTSSTPSDTSV